MADRISVTGISGFGRHGVFAHERAEGQTFVVDVALEVDLSAAGRSDALADTIDYGQVARGVVDAIEGEPLDLIEALAERIATTCLDDDRVRAVDVTVHKPMAPIDVPFDDVAVSVRRSRP